MDIKNKLIIHMRFFLINKLFLLKKEVYFIKWSLNYIKNMDNQLNSIDDKENNQFTKDCQLIIDFINMIEKNIKNILEILSDNKLEKKTILELIILFDCINERINNSVLKKFDYAYKSYENLILSYNHLYIPTTSISKLAKSPNLMLFFNKKLNDISQFFALLINKNDNTNYKEIFSTWNFISTDHLVDFYNEYQDDKDKIYLEFSFWLYEMPIFHCIAIHEIYHKYYFEETTPVKFDKEHLNFFKENLPKIIQKDTNLLIENFSENFIISLYQEILADLHAYIFAKENYLYTLFINGFLLEFNHSFLGIVNPNEVISFKDKCCANRINKMSVYNFDFKKKQILYFVRLFFLLKFIKKYDTDIYNKSETVNFIKNILWIIFPNNDNNIYENFDNFLKDFISYKGYKKNKYIIQILTEIYYKLFLSKDIFDIIKKRKKYIEQKSYYKNFTTRFNKIFIEKIKKINSDVHNDIKSNFIQVNHLVQEEFRKENIKELGIKLDFNEDSEGRIYFLTNIKISRYKQEDAFLLFKDKVYPQDKYFYSFGPFDFVRLDKKTDKFVNILEKELTDYDKNKTFFIDNHSLFYIKTYNKNVVSNNKDAFFNLLLSIDIKNAFSDKNNEKEIIIKFDEIFKEDLLKKYTAKLFFSMGNENIILLIYDITKEKLEEIINVFHKIEFISHISSTILLNNKFFSNKNTSLDDLIILVKLKPLNLVNKYDELFKIINKQNQEWQNFYKNNENIRLFKKLGVYDAKIIISKITIEHLIKLIEQISPFTIDIQIEKEIKVKT
jgi:hypothetical protein